MTVRRILLFTCTRIDRGNRITTQHTGLRQIGSQQRLTCNHQILSHIFGMCLKRQRSDPLVHFIHPVVHRRLLSGFQGQHFHADAGNQTINLIISRDVDFRDAAVLDIFLAFSVRTGRQILQLPQHGSCQLQPFARRVPVTDLRATVKRLERRTGRKVQHLRRYIAEQRMPGLSYQYRRFSPI